MSGGMIVSGGGWCQGGRCGQVEDVVREWMRSRGRMGSGGRKGSRGRWVRGRMVSGERIMS